MFTSSNDLLSTIEQYDQLVFDCTAGRISFIEFLERYDAFFVAYALDGHESDDEERNLFRSYDHRIAPHREIWEKIIAGGLCSDDDAQKESYVQAGRFGSDVGLKRLREIVEKHFTEEP